MQGTNSLKAEYDANGFVIARDLFQADAIRELIAESAAIARGERGELIGTSPSPGATDDEALARLIAIHFPHKLSPIMLQAMKHPPIVEMLTRLVGPDVKSMQSMLFVKGAGKPGQAWHQDEHFIATRDRSLIGVWIALDDATQENGCLWVQPGSHKDGILYPMRDHHDERFDHAAEVYDHPFDREGGIPVELKSGSAVFFNGYLLHRSLPNRARAGFRRALVSHYMSARSMLPWAHITGRPNPDFRDIVMIAGKDHYAWRGLEDITIPFVRPEDPGRAAAIFSDVAAEMKTRRTAALARTQGGDA